MNIILLENIEKVGFKDEIVSVKNGFARNLLIPQGKAILATSSSVKILEEKLRQQSKKEEKVIETANATAETLKDLDITIKAKIASGVKLFGKITLSNFMSSLDGLDINKDFVSIPNAKELGKYEATIRLHRTITVTVPFEVIAE
jgi:large subunit ribosomal protein L9